ncbi:MAG: DUF1207 domain-containing protein [Longimicrobiales bacterium]
MNVFRLLARTVVQAMILCCMLPALVRAQDDGIRRFLPLVHFFSPPVADPLEPRLSVGLLQTNLFRVAADGRERIRPFFIPDPEDAASDVDAVASIGGTLPIWLVSGRPDGDGVLVSFQGGVISRFRIEYPTREDVGQDWLVGMPIEMRNGKWSGRVRIMHRSSHLGDELVETTGAARIEVGGEFIDFLAAYSFRPHTRAYGGAAWTFRSYTDKTAVLLASQGNDRIALQAGAESASYPWVDGHLGWVAGIDWRRADRTDWDDSLALAAGLTVRSNGRVARFLLRYFTGASLLEQFFLTPENYWSIELGFDF